MTIVVLSFLTIAVSSLTKSNWPSGERTPVVAKLPVKKEALIDRWASLAGPHIHSSTRHTFRLELAVK